MRFAVWGTGNMGSAAIRCGLATPDLELVAVITSSPDKAGVDARSLAGLSGNCGVTATTDIDVALAGCDAVAYMASGDIRPDAAVDDIERCLLAGCSVVTPSIYALYDPSSAPADLVQRLNAACESGGSSLLVTGVDPGWANDVIAIIAASLSTRIREVRCQEVFDYSTYDQPHAVRVLCGFGAPMDETPMMLLSGVPTMVWGGNIRLIGRGMGVEVDDITEVVERVALDHDVENAMGRFDAGTQGAFRLQIIGWVNGAPRIVIEHVTRITEACAPDWLQPDDGPGEHRVTIDGDPAITMVIRADVDGGTRADGGNATAVNRLLGAIPWLSDTTPGIYDGLSVPLGSAAGRWSA